ncbi:ankyrin repeat domain-containing protein [Pseudomonas cremoricolorata]|uniref:ankyrin repeat domain-containing protein n=1 Tax=Pseudomonas cremoricolorata TaxID=157783 RepID=UPI0003F931E4|nr:ankyrin repeat domain-containing protein [Pseudomonas cremoricolorata]
MQDAAPAAMTDEETAAFAAQVFDCARAGDAQMLDRLISSGLPVDLRNGKGDTLLMLASYHGHFEAVQVLLRHGADPLIANDNNQLPIAGAAFKGDLPMIRLLVENGVPVDAAAQDGRTALMLAAMFNRGEILEYLLAEGADPTHRDARGATALVAAQTMGAVEAVERLQALAG